MFKVGDKVRVKVKFVNNSLRPDTIYTVRAIYQPPGGGYDGVSLEGVGNYGNFPWHPCRFELVEEEKPFNISTATDQELADKYREGVKESYTLSGELRARGYNIYTPNNRLVVFTTHERVIKKTVTDVIEL